MSLTEFPGFPALSQPALCAQTDPELFFPEKGQPNTQAKRICRACDAQAECLEWAVTFPEGVTGIWGGTNETERRKLRAKRGIKRAPVSIMHGTEAGYQAHYRRGVPMCDPCRQAKANAIEKRRAA